MSQLYRFYNDLLSKLPFSVAGYPNVEEEIIAFFTRLSNDSLLRASPAIQFLSYSYVTLSNHRNWETTPLSDQFYFHAHNERYSDLLTSVYTYMRVRILEDLKGTAKPKKEEKQENPEKEGVISNAHRMASLFVKDCGFRVRCTEAREWSFGYLHDRNVLSFELPTASLFKSTEEEFRGALAEFLADASKERLGDKDAELFVQASSHNRLYRKIASSSTKYNKTNIGALHSRFYEKAFNSAGVKKLNAELVDAVYYFHVTNPGYFKEGETREKTIEAIRGWISRLHAIAFIGYCYSGWVEYMPSTCGVLGRDKKEYRNLGSLIIGYRDDSLLTLDDRVLFKLISDRVSSVLASDFLAKLLRHEPTGKRWWSTRTTKGAKNEEFPWPVSYSHQRIERVNNTSTWMATCKEVDEKATKIWNDHYAGFITSGTLPKGDFKRVASVTMHSKDLKLEDIMLFRRIYMGLWYQAESAVESFKAIAIPSKHGKSASSSNWKVGCVLEGTSVAEVEKRMNGGSTNLFEGNSGKLRKAGGFGDGDLIDGDGVLPEEEKWLKEMGITIARPV